MKDLKYRFLLLSCVFLLSYGNAQAWVVDSAAIGMIVQEQFSTGKILITQLEVEKPHIIPNNLLVRFFSQYEGSEIDVDDVKAIQTYLSKYYYAKGYINSGVIVPNQRIIDGKLRFRAIHGRLNRVKASGNQRLSNAYIRNAILRGVSVPLSTQKMQLALEDLQKHPLISHLKANIFPGRKLGGSILDISITEASPYFARVELSNHRSPSIGQYRVGVNVGHRDLFGVRDVLNVDFGSSVDDGLSVGVVNGGADYALPISIHDFMFRTYVNYAEFTILDDAFTSVNIQSKSTSFGFSQSMPLMKTNHADISVGIGLDVKRMTLTMFGEPATLSSGFVDGESHSTPLVIHFDAMYQKRGVFISMHGGYRRGLNLSVYGANRSNEREFHVGVGQLSVGLKLMPKLEWHIRANTQLTRDSLLPAEKYAVGGVKSVRGYRENLLVRDNGFTASTQFRYGLYRNALHLVPFFDYGRSWNSDQGTLGGGGENIYSAGIGLQWQTSKGFYSDIFWGKTLVDVESNNDQSQDYSLHFLLRYSFN